MSFAQTLEYGVAGESAIANWLKRRHGYAVLPVYEKIIDTGKGPQVYTATEDLVAPDLLVYHGDKVLWIEAKRKSAFAWNYTRGIWTTGIDKRHFGDYCRVDDTSPWPVWLLFLQEGGRAKDCRVDKDSPAGLFGNTLAYLREHINHESDKHGRTGMVYWAKDDLKLIAELSEVLNAA